MNIFEHFFFLLQLLHIWGNQTGLYSNRCLNKPRSSDTYRHPEFRDLTLCCVSYTVEAAIFIQRLPLQNEVQTQNADKVQLCVFSYDDTII